MHGEARSSDGVEASHTPVHLLTWYILSSWVDGFVVTYSIPLF